MSDTEKNKSFLQIEINTEITMELSIMHALNQVYEHFDAFSTSGKAEINGAVQWFYESKCCRLNAPMAGLIGQASAK